MSDEPLHCEWCLTDSGRLNAYRKCCIVRGLAKCPKERRKAHYERVKVEDGKDAANELIAAVNAEMARLKAMQKASRNAVAEQAIGQIKDLLG